MQIFQSQQEVNRENCRKGQVKWLGPVMVMISNPRYSMALSGTLQGHLESGLESTLISVINGVKTLRIFEKQI